MTTATPSFPIPLVSSIDRANGRLERHVILNGAFSVVLGPNGSGKTHLLRGLKAALGSAANGKTVRFLSAGRMGLLEQYRSDYDGQRGTPNYEGADYGGKRESRFRHATETLQGDFQTLAERMDIQIKVQERLRKLFRRDLLVEWDAGRLRILFNRIGTSSEPYSSSREASGLMHLTGILSALYDDEVGALLIDEPEVSLHPQLQAFLLQEMLEAAGVPGPGSNKKLIIVATHSTEMIPLRSVGDLPSLIFCNDLDTDPVQIPPDAPELKSRTIRNLVATLGQLHRLALFSKRPLLVEGSSDAIVCQGLARKFLLYPEAAGSQLLPVEGKGNMPIVAKLLRLMGKLPTALADLDGFADGPKLVQDYLASIPDVSAREAAHFGAASGSALAKEIFTDLAQTTDDSWETLCSLATKHNYYKDEKHEESIRRRRSVLAFLLSTGEDELSALPNGSSFINLRRRIEALFSISEKCGLFFCRRGTIEDHFLEAVSLTDLDKPEAASDEATRILGHDIATLEAHYSDVVRCIRFASNAEIISEAEALQDLMLSILAPAQARLRSAATEFDFNAVARQTLGDRAKLFDIRRDGNELVITVQSNILDVDSSSPMRITADEDVVLAVKRILGI